MLPASPLTRLQVQVLEPGYWTLADGHRVEPDYGMARFSIDNRVWPCPVLFGPEGEYRLGRTTLEIFNLTVDPSGEKLVPKILRARPI